MTETTPKKFKFESDAFNIAQLLWNDLLRYNGLAMGCGECPDANLIGWLCYDSESYPDPPTLNQTFERVVCDGYLDRIKGLEEQIAWVKMMRFFITIGGQVLIKLEKNSSIKSETLLEILDKAGFTQVKKFSDGVVYAYNV